VVRSAGGRVDEALAGAEQFTVAQECHVEQNHWALHHWTLRQSSPTGGRPWGRGQASLWGRGLLKNKKIDQVIESARTTQGVPIGKGEMAWLQEIGSELHKSISEVKACRQRLTTLAESHVGMRKHVEAVGVVTLCVIWSHVGDPGNYSSSGAFLKALGLNLKELSSGKRHGQLAITKRGPGLARKYLYFWALRAVQRPELKGWYLDFQQVGHGSESNTEYRKMKGLVALMRKLSRSLWYVRAHEQEFDYEKVFPGQPLEKRKRGRSHRKKAEVA
jgi:transposase